MASETTFISEDTHMAPFFAKQRISIERGEGIYVWDEEGNRYIDFTSGWGVTCIGHGNTVISEALQTQAHKIIQNPNSGLTYSPARARLLELMRTILPGHLSRVFFTNSGAEANDAALKLARKVTGRTDVISTLGSFHGRTISTASATGQKAHRGKYTPLMPNYRFIRFDDVSALAEALDTDVAAVILEPIQGEGGVRIPTANYLSEVQALCHKNGSLLIVDEIQTGFCRTGPMFVTGDQDIKVDILTMAKGIAGGFPFGAFAMSEEVSSKLDLGDHGGTYCGNPLGCAVAYAVINYLCDHQIAAHVEQMGKLVMKRLEQWKRRFPEDILDVRGQGLLQAIEFSSPARAGQVCAECLNRKLFARQTQETCIRLFPALTIQAEELEMGLTLIEDVIEKITKG
jgi:acetylornithine/N-succinyldiaminopimelate aminotransferase